jgi:ElaB/YqjD/DUF883 family membrane-anchored ribosome-binding protein
MNSHDRQVADLKNQVSELSDRLEKLAGSAQDTAKGYLDDMKDVPGNLMDGLDSAKDSAKKAAGQVHEYAKENPWQVAGMAAAAGFLLAMLSRKRD